MHFCSKCSNMYYIRIDEANSNKLIYYCRNCQNTDESLAVENVNVLKTQVKQEEQSFKTIINQYTKLDPTLPRCDNIMCPNKECLTNTKNKPREIIFLRYDDKNMKYVYLCSECDFTWKTTDKV